MISPNKTFFLSALFLLAASQTATAQETNIGSEVLNKGQFIDLLSAPEAPPLVTRGIRMHDVTEREPSPAAAISMQAHFEYNSDALTSSAKDQLKGLGEALESEQLRSLSFLIEGHTDAAGTEQYNQELSLRRAASVKRYLTNNFRVSPEKLLIKGKGEESLWNKTDPMSWENRRVSIKRLD